MRFKSVALLIAFGILALSSPAKAGLVSYSDYTSWSAAVPAITSVSVPEPASGFDYFGTGDGSVSYGGVVFSTSATLGDGNFFNVGFDFSGFPAALSSQAQTTGVANILITLPSSVTAFSLNFATFGGSDVSFKLSNGNSLVLSSFDTAYELTNFFGVAASSPFNSVLVTTTDTALNLNAFAFGNAVPAIPEPSTWLLMFLGFAGIAGMRRVFASPAPTVVSPLRRS